MPAHPPSFEETIASVAKKLADNLDTLNKAAENEASERQDFLSKFRDKAQNDILPVLNGLERFSNAAFKPEVTDISGGECVELKVQVTLAPDRRTSLGLRYRGCYKRRRILIEQSEGGKPYVESDAVQPETLSRAAVEDHVKYLVLDKLKQ